MDVRARAPYAPRLEETSMNRSMCGGFFLLAALATISVAMPDERDPSGDWKIVTEGQKGGVTITKAPRGAHRFELRWQTGGESYEGIGLRRDGHLYCSWGVGANGIMVWRREGNHWSADWIHKTQAEERLGSETIQGTELAGTHTIEGTAPNGNTYTGSVAIEKTGDTYKMSWTIGDQQYVGVGIESGDKLVVAYGRGNFGCMDYDLSRDEEMEGRWAARADTRTAVERLRRRR
jgi:hypothetical protein